MTDLVPVTITRADRSREVRNFGIADSRGREIGGAVETWAQTYEARTDGSRWGQIAEPELIGKTVFCYQPHALRNGREYGAIQRTVFFDSAEARDAAVQKYFLAAQKRAAKANVRPKGA